MNLKYTHHIKSCAKLKAVGMLVCWYGISFLRSCFPERNVYVMYMYTNSNFGLNTFLLVCFDVGSSIVRKYILIRFEGSIHKNKTKY